MQCVEPLLMQMDLAALVLAVQGEALEHDPQKL